MQCVVFCRRPRGSMMQDVLSCMNDLNADQIYIFHHIPTWHPHVSIQQPRVVSSHVLSRGGPTRGPMSGRSAVDESRSVRGFGCIGPSDERSLPSDHALQAMPDFEMSPIDVCPLQELCLKFFKGIHVDAIHFCRPRLKACLNSYSSLWCGQIL